MQTSQALSEAKVSRAFGAPHTSDESLIALIADGDKSAMRVLFGRHNVRVYRFILRFVSDQSLAEDLVSEVFFDVWRQAGKFEGRSAVSTWLLGMARFKALSALRTRTPDQLDETYAANIEDTADSPETMMQKADRSAILRQVLSRLSAEHREIIDLVYYHEKSIAEVAEIIGAPLNTVKTRMFYARRKIAEMLEAEGLDRVMVA